jgi:endoglucanase
MQTARSRLGAKIIGLGGLCLLTASFAHAASEPQPYIQTFSPTSGAVGTVITVTGSGFTGLTTAWIGKARDGVVHVLSDTKVEVTVPHDAVTGQLAVLNPLHSSFSPNSFTITKSSTSSTTSTTSTTSSTSTKSSTTASGSSATVPQPYIISFSPFSGPDGTVVTLHGTGFTGLNSAWIGSTHGVGVTVVSDSEAQVKVPNGTTTGQIALFNSKHVSFAAEAFVVTKVLASSGTSTTSTTSSTSTGKVGTGAPSTGTSTTGSTTSGSSGSSSSTSSGSTTSTGSTTTTSASTSLKVSISGDHFVDATGKTLQLRGANVSGLEFVAVQGWDPASPWGGQAGPTTPNFTAMKSWDINVVRLPLNEASWLGYTCVDATGASRNPDPGHNYQATVIQAVADATAAGLYVIIDLHWTAPKNFCPLAQNPMADADNSLNFWKSVATQFKGSPNVMFELFNEPYVYWLATPNTEWQTEMQGGSITQYVTGAASPYQVAYTWKVASMQDMLNTVRATGATNPVLVAGVNWAGDLSEWLANKPTDSLNQIAAVWHAYPAYGTTFGTSAYALPGGGQASYANAQSVISAGIPVIITESGDQDTAGTVGAPFESKLLPWADKAGASYLGWAWDVWQDASDVLIKDASGTPTDGYGAYFKQHLNCVATGSVTCQ